MLWLSWQLSFCKKIIPMVTLEQKDRNSGHKAASHCSVRILIHSTSSGSVMCPGWRADIGLLALSVARLGPGARSRWRRRWGFLRARASRLGHSWSQTMAAPKAGWATRGGLDPGCLDGRPCEPLPALSSVWKPEQPWTSALAPKGLTR